MKRELPTFGAYAAMMAPVAAAGTPILTLNDAFDGGKVLSKEENGDSRCSSLSDGESFECVADGGVGGQDADATLTSAAAAGQPLRRDTWLRTSLRKTPPRHQDGSLPNRRWGSFRTSGKRLNPHTLSSPLHRSSSFNSSGRSCSSACDGAEEIYSDLSLEEDVLDLNHKVQMLQQQVGALADSQNSTDERYAKARQDNAALQARTLMLEEQLREAEERAEERLAAETRRHRELAVRLEREKQLELENCAMRQQALEVELNNVREEVKRQRADADRLRAEKSRVQDAMLDAENAAASARADAAAARSEVAQLARGMDELKSELERIRSEKLRQTLTNSTSSTGARREDTQLASRVASLEEQLERLRAEKRLLQESNDELQALLLTRGVEEGRSLLTGTATVTGSGSNVRDDGHGSYSLAAELEAMSADEIKPMDKSLEEISLSKMRVALKEQQEVNIQLRAYIDGILLSIVDNYPQLLEVKRAS